MTTTHAIPLLGSESWLHRTDASAILLEPLLIVGSALFWLCALPLAAGAMLVLKISQTTVALLCGRMVRPNPLILRKASHSAAFSHRSSAPAGRA